MRDNIPVKYSPEKYDEYTARFLEVYDQLIIDALAREYHRRSEAPVLLDIATGTAQVPIKICARPEFDGLKITGLDFFEDMLEQARKTVREHGLSDRIEIVYGDAHKMPIADKSVDFIISRSTIHHWANPVAVFREIHRVLKPNGIALVHDIRRDPNPQVLAEFNHRRAQCGVPPCNIEEKYTVAEVERMLVQADIGHCAKVLAWDEGPAALGFELRVTAS
jgi:ubiquinone/menaquinone biosynthesis C-methylase UbiE